MLNIHTSALIKLENSVINLQLNCKATLDKCITHCCRECKTVGQLFDMSQKRMMQLEEFIKAQEKKIAKLKKRVEGVACYFCPSGKGKGKAVEPVLDIPLLGSPIILDWSSRDGGSSRSYHTPPIVSTPLDNTLSISPLVQVVIGLLVKENS